MINEIYCEGCHLNAGFQITFYLSWKKKHCANKFNGIIEAHFLSFSLHTTGKFRLLFINYLFIGTLGKMKRIDNWTWKKWDSFGKCCCLKREKKNKNRVFVTWDSECCPFHWIACITTTVHIVAVEMNKLKQVTFMIILSDEHHFTTWSQIVIGRRLHTRRKKTS